MERTFKAVIHHAPTDGQVGSQVDAVSVDATDHSVGPAKQREVAPDGFDVLHVPRCEVPRVREPEPPVDEGSRVGVRSKAI